MIKRRKGGRIEIKAGIASLHRLDTVQKAEELEEIFRRYSDEFRPVYCDESRKLPFSSWPEGLQTLIPGHPTMKKPGRVSGEPSRTFFLGKPLFGTVLVAMRTRGIDPCHALILTMGYEPLVKLGLFDEWNKLFADLVAWAEAEYAYAFCRSENPWKYLPAEQRVMEYKGITIPVRNPGRLLGSWLDDLVWLNVLGSHYQEFFGRDRLMKTDAFSTWEDSGGRIWMRLCEKPEEAHTEEGVRLRDRVKVQLGVSNAFLPDSARASMQRPEDFRSPNFDRSEFEETNRSDRIGG